MTAGDPWAPDARGGRGLQSVTGARARCEEACQSATRRAQIASRYWGTNALLEAIPGAEETAAVRAFRGDVDVGRLARPACDLTAVFIRAEALSAKHSGGIGGRNLDLLHVAAALETGCVASASFDDRQRKVAALAGLKLIPTRHGA